jgi:hypothetical protein
MSSDNTLVASPDAPVHHVDWTTIVRTRRGKFDLYWYTK